MLPSEELDNAKKDMSEDKFAQEFMADFRKYEGAVYKEFDRIKHTYTEDTLLKPINVKETICGLDWGFTNPTAVLKIIIDNDDNIFIDEEFYQTQRTTEEVAEFMKTWKPAYVYPDPAEPDRNKTLRDKGLYVRDVNKDIKAGVDKVRELFRNNKIKVNERCKNLIRELEMYQYPDGINKDLPIKEI